MNIAPIPQTGKWSDAAATMDFNNSKINLELLKLKNATSKNFGYFALEALLTAAYPTPALGDIAFCGATYPGVVYDCLIAGTWHSTGVAAVDLFKNNDYINITVNFPLESGYYTLASAIAAVTTDLKQLGLTITFAASATEWQTWQFEGSLISGWNTVSNWTMLINTKHQITLEKSVAEILNVLYAKITALEEIVSKMNFDTAQIDTLTIAKELKFQGASLFIIATASPSITPDFSGQIYIKTTDPKAVYIANGASSASDWTPINN